MKGHVPAVSWVNRMALTATWAAQRLGSAPCCSRPRHRQVLARNSTGLYSPKAEAALDSLGGGNEPQAEGYWIELIEQTDVRARQEHEIAFPVAGEFIRRGHSGRLSLKDRLMIGLGHSRMGSCDEPSQRWKTPTIGKISQMHDANAIVFINDFDQIVDDPVGSIRVSQQMDVVASLQVLALLSGYFTVFTIGLPGKASTS